MAIIQLVTMFKIFLFSRTFSIVLYNMLYKTPYTSMKATRVTYVALLSPALLSPG